MKILLSSLSTELSKMRLLPPKSIRKMEDSILQFGQLRAIIVRATNENSYQIIDGFKRYYACQKLEIEELEAKIIEVSPSIAPGMIINYNKSSQSMTLFEECLVVYSLYKEHLMQQQEISRLLNYSRSWVCRRISLIENLDESVQVQLQMGLITSSHARELSRLPRGNQSEVLRSIISNNLTTAQSRQIIIKYIQSTHKQEKEFILAHPLKVISNLSVTKEIYDTRLGDFGNKLLKTTHLLTNQQHILIGQLSNYRWYKLNKVEKQVLVPKLINVRTKSTILGNQISHYIEKMENEK